ncbi:11432_t:CDS:1, partial [Cetraspora pellucida]
MQSELDLLREENAKLLAENAQLRQIIEEKDSHAKLRDAELNSRIAELERSAKEHAESARQSQTENAELKGRVANLEQEFKKRDLQFLTEEYESTFQIENHNSDITSQKNTDISQSPASTIETHPDEENNTSSIDLKQVQSAISSESDLDNTSKQVINTTSVTSNLREIKQSSESQIPGSVKLKSLEEKEIDEFIDLENKKRVSNIMRQRNGETFQDKNTSLDNISSVEPVSSKPLCNIKTMNTVHDRKKIIPESAQNVPEKYIKDSSLVTEIVQGLLQGFLVNSIEDNIEFINSEPSDSPPGAVELAHLLYQACKATKKSIKTKREEISSWGRYSERFEDKVIELRSKDKNLKDKTARAQIYNEMRPYLTGITDEYLRKITSKARKINKLFGYDYDPMTLKKNKGIGWHMVNRVTYSADTISRLTNLQIQYIIDQVGVAVSKTVNTVHNQTKTE